VLDFTGADMRSRTADLLITNQDPLSFTTSMFTLTCQDYCNYCLSDFFYFSTFWHIFYLFSHTVSHTEKSSDK